MTWEEYEQLERELFRKGLEPQCSHWRVNEFFNVPEHLNNCWRMQSSLCWLRVDLVGSDETRFRVFVETGRDFYEFDNLNSAVKCLFNAWTTDMTNTAVNFIKEMER